MIFLMIILGFLSTALMEYLLHRYYLHKKGGHNHIHIHHKNFKGDQSFENNKMNLKDIMSSPGYIFITSSPALILTVLFYFNFGLISLWLYFFSIAYDLWLEFVHYLFHSPKRTKFETSKFFLLLKENHRVHHEKFKYNYGIGSTFYDYIFKTKF